eukprot:scaffold15446_cov107-Isochrysis_galbana.AAC.3
MAAGTGSTTHYNYYMAIRNPLGLTHLITCAPAPPHLAKAGWLMDTAPLFLIRFGSCIFGPVTGVVSLSEPRKESRPPLDPVPAGLLLGTTLKGAAAEEET